MIKRHLPVLLFVLFAACFFALAGCSRDDAGVLANEDVIAHKAFVVSGGTSTPGSSITGTVFVLGKNGSKVGDRIQITATVRVDDSDWAGVELDIPKEWRISSILSDYPQRGNNLHPESYVTVWSKSPDADAFDKFVRIGHTKQFPDLGRGGQGNISISLEPAVPVKELPKNFEIRCGVGSRGDSIAYPSYMTVSVPLSSQ